MGDAYCKCLSFSHSSLGSYSQLPLKTEYLLEEAIGLFSVDRYFKQKKIFLPHN